MRIFDFASKHGRVREVFMSNLYILLPLSFIVNYGISFITIKDKLAMQQSVLWCLMVPFVFNWTVLFYYFITVPNAHK